MFPVEREGDQAILWRYCEHELEAVGFKLNDIYFRDIVQPDDLVSFVRHKERKFGRGCLEQWRSQQKNLLRQLEQLLLPCEQMLAHRSFLLADRPLFVDFELFGILENFLYSGHYALAKKQPHLRQWHRNMISLKRTP